MRKLKIGILTSQNCEDGLVLLKKIRAGRLDAEVKIILSDRQKIYPLEVGRICREENIPLCFENPFWSNKEQYDRKLIFMLERCNVGLVLCIGYMRILTPVFTERYRGKIMNIHPSLLPAFVGGMDRRVHQAVLNSGVKITGCTLHFVTEELDVGPIILQKVVAVKENETVESLRDKVQVAEQEILIKAIRLFQANRLKVEGKKVRILPKPH